jgi:glucose/arabinose dehydrogenase
VEDDKRRAAVTEYNEDGGGERRFASGLRNAVGLTVNPKSNTIWAPTMAATGWETTFGRKKSTTWALTEAMPAGRTAMATAFQTARRAKTTIARKPLFLRWMGRPAGLVAGPEGALYVSDDSAGVVYRLTCER